MLQFQPAPRLCKASERGEKSPIVGVTLSTRVDFSVSQLKYPEKHFVLSADDVLQNTTYEFNVHEQE